MKRSGIVSVLLSVFLFSCYQKQKPGADDKRNFPNWKQPKKIDYELKDAKQWLQEYGTEASKCEIVFAVNRTDRLNFSKMDSVIVPVDLSGDLVYYLPFPLEVPSLKEVNKLIFFSYPTQTFAAYENGILVYTGPTNMGRKNNQTPTGLFFTNWKSKKTISTFNDEWELLWNFNIANKAGIGWHQYTLPGYPASHSCLRLQEKDAKQLYKWADEWVLANKNKISLKGTPVIVFGSYDFDALKPWLRLLDNPHELDISEKELQDIAEPFLYEILAEQKKRENYQFSSH